MRKKYVALLFSIMLVLLLGACGKTESQKEKGTEKKDNTTIESSETKDKEVETESEKKENETTETVEIPKDHIHSYTTKVVAATCAKDGYTLNSCECGDSYKTDTVKATGHSYGGWNTTKAATAKEKGRAERVCASCGDVDKKELDKLPKNHEHSYTKKVVEATCKAEGYTTHTCSCGDSYTDNKTSKKAHSYKAKVTAPTCTTEGYTTYTCSCGDSYIGDKTAKTSHTYTDKVTNPTCTTEGYTRHVCSKCGSAYTDNKVSATGHSYSVTSNTATCTADGKKTETCGKCGDKKTSNVSATGHDEKIETKAATCISKGYTKVTCKKCNTVISNTEIPRVKEHTWKTKTLAQAALEAYESGDSEYMPYLKFTEHNVKMCDLCKYIDLSTATSVYTEYEKAQIMLGYVNELRRQVLGDGYDLVLDTKLIELSNIRAKEISVNFSHYGGTYTNAGENITEGGATIKTQFERWKASPGHYTNMIQENYKYFAYASYAPDLQSRSLMFGVQLFWSENSKNNY